VRDNGRGISEEEVIHARSIGLIGMRERVAQVGGQVFFFGLPAGAPRSPCACRCPRRSNGNGAMRILIADDHAVVRQGLKQILAGAFKRSVFGEAANSQEALERVWKEPWDIVILDSRCRVAAAWRS
jgi:hypothetical protein